jgi:phenylacetate-CoA ligase
MTAKGLIYRSLRTLSGRGVSRKVANEIRQWDDVESENALKLVLERSRRSVPYYRRFNLPIDLDLDLFPILRKEDIRKNFADLHADSYQTRRTFRNSSGGSTGKPVTIVQDSEFEAWRIGTEDFFHREFLRIPDYETVSKVILWGSERDLFGQRSVYGKIGNFLADRHFVNAFMMTPEDLLRAIEVINCRRAKLLKGYAGSLYQLARFVLERGIKVHRPEAVYSAAETLRPMMRSTIEEAFAAPVFNYYGSREVGAIAGQCGKGRMHIFDFNTRVEVLSPTDEPVSPGAEGRVVVTTLHNHSMPLIRYDIGDRAIPAQGCDCGSKLPALERISGRITDHFLTEGGKLVNGEYFTHLFYFSDVIEEFQVVQEDVLKLRVTVVPRGPITSRAISEINEKIRLVMGSACAIQWEQVAAIQRSPQGKRLFTQSLLDQDRLTSAMF